MNIKTATQTVLGLLAICVLTPTYAEPGDIVIIRDVPPQRFTDNRHTGQATIINPSPVQQTNQLRDMFNGNQGISELTDLQTSGITSNIGSTLSTITNSALSVDLANQISGSHSGSSVAGQMGSIQGMTSGLGRSIGGSVTDATRGTGAMIRDALSGTLPGQ